MFIIYAKVYAMYVYIFIHKMFGKYTHVYYMDIQCTYSALHLHIPTMSNVCHLCITVYSLDMQYPLNIPCICNVYTLDVKMFTGYILIFFIGYCPKELFD